MNTRPDTCVVLVSGGAGYIGSHVSHVLKHAGFTPVVVDSLVNGNLWATRGASAFRKGDIGDADFIRAVCDEVRPMAAIHFAAFIEVGESVKKPEKYFTNNRDKAKVFFDTLAKGASGTSSFPAPPPFTAQLRIARQFPRPVRRGRSIPTANRSWKPRLTFARSKM